VIAVTEEASSADDIEQFVARMIVQPPPPSPPTLPPSVSADIEHDVPPASSYCPPTSYTDRDDVIVTSHANSHVTTDHSGNTGNCSTASSTSYPRAGSIDKSSAADLLYVNLPKRRQSDLPPRPPLPQTMQLSRSRDVIGHVIIRFALCNFL